MDTPGLQKLARLGIIRLYLDESVEITRLGKLALSLLESVQGIKEHFDPKITILTVASFVFHFGVSASVTGLKPNTRYQLWIFGPNGTPTGGIHGLVSDNIGRLFFPSETNLSNPPLSSSSDPTPKGEYFLGINEGQINYNKRFSFQDWKNITLSKKYQSFF